MTTDRDRLESCSKVANKANFKINIRRVADDTLIVSVSKRAAAAVAMLGLYPLVFSEKKGHFLKLPLVRAC